MTRIKLFVVTITACALMGAGCSYSQTTRLTPHATSVIPSETEWSRGIPSKGSLRSSYLLGRDDMGTSTESFIDADVFAIPELTASAEWLKGEEKFVCRKFRAGIVNHHALASDLLAGFFRTLARCRSDLKTIIILSPDHFQQTSASVTTHRLPYRVAGVEYQADTESIDRLLSTVSSAREMSAMFEREHGVGALLPFMAESFPDVKLVPVVIRSQISDADREVVSVWLKKEMARAGTFVIVSADMSHYLNEQRAMSNDQQTKRALETNDEEFFQKAKDDFTDNGESIAATLGALGKTKWTLLAESISSAYAGSPGFTTTYAVGFWD